ncbi:MAG TPA: hypothetical protein VFA07_04830 [Chthonomonadaceae bacterium]|nr:hypothetical protein [Chthonomonadaceae bacterium]
MNAKTRQHTARTEDAQQRRQSDLCAEPMMEHLLNALKAGQDIGHYGRLTFVMVARFFMDDDQIVSLLAKQPDFDEEKARALLMQVKAHNYNPPQRERILEWQTRQDFPILPNPEDPDCGQVYRNLQFPEEVYGEIEEYYEEKAEAEGVSTAH